MALDEQRRFGLSATLANMRCLLQTQTFLPDQYAEALESWAWIGLDGKNPVLSSSFGSSTVPGARRG